jgi:hypothetical protein
MARSSVIILAFLICCETGGQAPVGAWSDHLSYNTTVKVAVSPKEVYASTGSSIIVYNREYSELKKLSRVNGLSSTGISSISWSDEHNILVIAYTDADIDLVSRTSVFNISDILKKNITGNKTINRIRTNGRYAYMAGGFGIVVVDLLKREISDTWKPGPGPENNEVHDIAFGNNRVYAATSTGVWFAELSNQGLAYFGNWSKITTLPNPDARYTLALLTGNKLYVNESGSSSSGDSVYAIDINNECSLFSFTSGIINNSFDKAPNGFTVSSSGTIKYYRNDGSLQQTISSYGWGTPNISQGIADINDFWIADINYGLIRGESKSVYTVLALPGPASNDVISILSQNGKTFITGGGTDNSWNRLGKPFRVSVHDNNQFTNHVSGSINDALRVVPDPNNSGHFFVSTWGSGLVEYEKNEFKKRYDETNSPLQNMIPGGPGIEICGLAMDKSGNLWVTQSGVSGSIKILKPDGRWIVNPLTIDADVIGDILITSKGHKWIILPGGNGLYVLDDNKTPDIFSDDRSKMMLIKDSEGITISNLFSITEDLDGNIWIGTDRGPVICYNTEKIFEDDFRVYRIKVPRNDGTGLADYMLGSETITSISVDGANRKWLGTLSSGAYLLSADGTTMLKNYNLRNSPMLSDNVLSVSVDNKSGEVWFGTLLGVLSVRGDATSGSSEFTTVYAFPNPVREYFQGSVTITGLIRDSQIRITDISGNLVCRTVSEGGQASWDLTTYDGRRVTTGVYLVFCASSDGSSSFVTKVLVVR